MTRMILIVPGSIRVVQPRSKAFLPVPRKHFAGSSEVPGASFLPTVTQRNRYAGGFRFLSPPKLADSRFFQAQLLSKSALRT